MPYRCFVADAERGRFTCRERAFGFTVDDYMLDHSLVVYV